jgi:uncharacterized protein with von Willebrand factor type A (vWA) domain
MKAYGKTKPPQRPHVTMDVLHKYSADYKLIFAGDATMSPT